MVKSKHYIGFILCFLLISFSAWAKVYNIQSGKELSELNLKPADTVILQNGNWVDEVLVFKGSGLPNNPIVLMAQQPSSVKLCGNSNLKIDGEWLQVLNLLFTDGFSKKDDVIVFSKTSAHCTLSNCCIINYNPPAMQSEYIWVSLYGSHNKVEHCTFSGKKHQGATLVVWLSEKPNFHQIKNNYFGARPPLGNNGGETIRIGTSQWSMYNSSTLVEKNIFDKCDGEMEIISVKSCNNTITNNLFYECQGTLTLRHGNSNTVSGNYFIGNYKPETGGIRIIGSNHTVSNNYLYALTGNNLRSAICVMNGKANPALNEYWQVKNARIQSNTIVNCNVAFALAIGSNTRSLTVVPDSVVIENNYVLYPNTLLVMVDSVKHLLVKNNQELGAVPVPGFSLIDTNMLTKSSNQLWQLTNNKVIPFWLTDAMQIACSAAPIQFPISENKKHLKTKN